MSKWQEVQVVKEETGIGIQLKKWKNIQVKYLCEVGEGDSPVPSKVINPPESSQVGTPWDLFEYLDWPPSSPGPNPIESVLAFSWKDRIGWRIDQRYDPHNLETLWNNLNPQIRCYSIKQGSLIYAIGVEVPFFYSMIYAFSVSRKYMADRVMSRVLRQLLGYYYYRTCT